LVGFALETDNEEANALSKMERKNLDMIVLNSLRDEGAGFGTDTNRITIFSRSADDGSKLPADSKRTDSFKLSDGLTRTDFPLESKSSAATHIVNRIDLM
jgi:phosphopantothenoylcysteine synthetase/decarboxylase